MSWRQVLAGIESESAPLGGSGGFGGFATPTGPPDPENRQNRQNRHSPELAGADSEPPKPPKPPPPPDDSDDVDHLLEVADLIRRSGVEGLTVADLDADTALNLIWFARLGTAARPGLRIWCRALAAAKRSTSGLGVVSVPVGSEVLVGVARRGRWSRLLTIEREVFSPFALVELLERLAPDLTPSA